MEGQNIYWGGGGASQVTARSSPIPSGAMTAMTKLSECMVRHQEAVTKVEEERKDTRLKAWLKLPTIQKNVILLAGVDEQGLIPTEPTDEMLSILGCANGE